MNIQQGINFAEAREVLEKLATYANQKIQNKNAQTTQESVMNLAYQPEIASDHLGEESSLSLNAGMEQPSTDIETLEEPIITSETPFLETSQSDEGYKSVTNNATIGYPSEPPKDPAPVTMPNGMAPEMNFGESVVVGPEAFNITK